MGISVFRMAAALAVTAVMGLQAAPGAGAIPPPVIPPGPPPQGPVGPLTPTEQAVICENPTVRPDFNRYQDPAAAGVLNYQQAWDYSMGAGQTVAVIDTGVSSVPRLKVIPGGDYVYSGADGTQDCDGHGTLVAGIIAAAPSKDDKFMGVAPQARILAIRQNSATYQPVDGSSDKSGAMFDRGYGNATTLAYAITHAVDLGATVISIPTVMCLPADKPVAQDDLGRAVRNAYERNVVVIAAAGNISSGKSCVAGNPLADPSAPIQDGWRDVVTVSSPSWLQPYVLSVGSVNSKGEPSAFSMGGPWVSVAAPGEDIVSLDPRRNGIVDAYRIDNGTVSIQGTAFSAAYVSGVVALVRSAHPELTAAQVIDRIKRTARTVGEHPDTLTGYGIVDAVGAITGEKAPTVTAQDAKTQPAQTHPYVRRIALAATLGVIAASLGVLVLLARRKSD